MNVRHQMVSAGPLMWKPQPVVWIGTGLGNNYQCQFKTDENVDSNRPMTVFYTIEGYNT
jgi:hypothetical protein